MLYEDGAAAIDFLTNAFGFEEVMRMEDDRGSVNHAEKPPSFACLFWPCPGARPLDLAGGDR